MSAKQKVLLIQDVQKLGRSGEICDVAGGYARNYLIPKSYAVLADRSTIKLKEKLQKQRALKAQEDLQEAQQLASQLQNLVLKETVKVDDQGHMYGSVSALDLVRLFEEAGYNIPKNYIDLPAPYKKTGEYNVLLSLKEGVQAKVQLVITPQEHAQDEVVAT